jgi:YggT family protein
VILYGNLLAALARILHIILMIYLWIVIFRAILSWVHVPSLYPILVVLYRLTEPALAPVRRLVPPRRLGGLDISPIIVCLAILFVDSFVVNSMAIYARHLLRGAEVSF